MPQERVLFAAKSAPFSTAQEMMEYARKNPITMSDGGSFWSARVMEAFAKKHNLQVAVVAQRSGQAGSNEVMGGHVTMAETGTGTPAWSAAKGGDWKIIATLTPGGLASFGMPDIPTFEKLAETDPNQFSADFQEGWNPRFAPSSLAGSGGRPRPAHPRRFRRRMTRR